MSVQIKYNLGSKNVKMINLLQTDKHFEWLKEALPIAPQFSLRVLRGQKLRLGTLVNFASVLSRFQTQDVILIHLNKKLFLCSVSLSQLYWFRSF